MDQDNTVPVRTIRVSGSFLHRTPPMGTRLRAPMVRVLRPDPERAPDSGLYHANIGIHEGTRKPLSIWMLRPSLTATAIDANQLVDDVLRAMKLDHHNVERAVDVGEHHSNMYVAWHRAPAALCDADYYLPYRDAATIARIISGVASGLAAAHRGLLVHGCLEATDIAIRNGRSTVCGIGVWGFRRQALQPVLPADPTSSIAPEVQRAGAVGPRADVYSLAVIAAQLALHIGTSLAVPALRACLATQYPGLRAIHAALDPDPGKRPSGLMELAGEFASAHCS